MRSSCDRKAGDDLNVLALASYPEEAAATRFRICQLVPRLRQAGISVELLPFLDSSGFQHLYGRGSRRDTLSAIGQGLLRRVREVPRLRRSDVVLVQREAVLLGPPVFEALAASGAPLVLDVDDSTWVSYDSPTYGAAARWLKWPGKTEWLIRKASVVTCGSVAIADHVSKLGARAYLVPTVADPNVFKPRIRRDTSGLPVVGWIGTHSTFSYLVSVLPALRAVAARRPYRLLVVGAGAVTLDVPGAEVSVRDWSLDREVEDFQSLDVGLYPLVDDGWAGAKSGLKAIQYMAVGVAFVATALGANRDIGVPGSTHLEATTLGEWENALERLLSDPKLRERIGRAGRSHAEAHYTVEQSADALADALGEAAAGGQRRLATSR